VTIFLSVFLPYINGAIARNSARFGEPYFFDMKRVCVQGIWPIRSKKVEKTFAIIHIEETFFRGPDCRTMRVHSYACGEGIPRRLRRCLNLPGILRRLRRGEDVQGKRGAEAAIL
jgi:hypothetical protein